MVKIRKRKTTPRGFWTKEKCLSIAKDCKTRKEFCNTSEPAYRMALKNGWTEVFSHMVKGYIKYTYSDLRKEALKYHTKKDFKENSIWAYRACVQRKILKELCGHMKRKTSYDYTLNELKEEALKYKSRKEFKESNSKLFYAANRRGLITTICQHMVNPRIIWTKEVCRQESLKYNTRVELRNNSPICEDVIIKNKWQKELCSHMVSKNKPSRYWKNIDNLLKESAKYNSRSEFQRNCNGAYKSANEMNVLKLICDHMTDLRKPNHYWTKKRVKDEANKYTNRTDFNVNSKVAYTVAHRDGYLDEICYHMDFNIGDKYWRFVYEARDPVNKIIYIGLSYNLKKRECHHIEYNPRKEVAALVEEFGLKNLTPIVFKAEEAARYETQLIEKYRNLPEWTCLNILAGGQL